MSFNPYTTNIADHPADKENDIVARAKLEAKKKFDSTVPETDRQTWIEERVRDDYDKMMNKLAGQFHSDIAHLGPFQIGFASHYFDPKAWSHEKIDPQAIEAGRLLAEVFPGLIENNVSPRSEKAVQDLVTALESSRPSHLAFYEAVRILSENLQILQGADAVLAQLFAPRIGAFSLVRSRHGIHSGSLAASPDPQPISSQPNLPRPGSSHGNHINQNEFAQQSYGKDSKAVPQSTHVPGSQGPTYSAAGSPPTFHGYVYQPYPNDFQMQPAPYHGVYPGQQIPLPHNYPPDHAPRPYPEQRLHQTQQFSSRNGQRANGTASHHQQAADGFRSLKDAGSSPLQAIELGGSPERSNHAQHNKQLATAPNIMMAENDAEPQNMPGRPDRHCEVPAAKGPDGRTTLASTSPDVSEIAAAEHVREERKLPASHASPLLDLAGDTKNQQSPAHIVSDQSSVPMPLDESSPSKTRSTDEKEHTATEPMDLSDSLPRATGQRLSTGRLAKEVTPDRNIFVTDSSATSPEFRRDGGDPMSEDDEPQPRASRRDRKPTAKAQELTKLSSRRKRHISPQSAQSASKIVKLYIPSMRKSDQDTEGRVAFIRPESERESHEDVSKSKEFSKKSNKVQDDQTVEQNATVSRADSNVSSPDQASTIVVAITSAKEAIPHLVERDDTPSIGRGSLRSRKSVVKSLDQGTQLITARVANRSSSDANSTPGIASRIARRQPRLRRSALAGALISDKTTELATADEPSTVSDGRVQPATRPLQQPGNQGESTTDSSLYVWADIAGNWHESDADDEGESSEAERKYQTKVVQSLQDHAARKGNIVPPTETDPVEASGQRQQHSHDAVPPPPPPLPTNIPMQSTQPQFGFSPYFQYYGFYTPPQPPQGYWNQQYAPYQPALSGYTMPNPGFHSFAQQPAQVPQYSHPAQQSSDPQARQSGALQSPADSAQQNLDKYSTLLQARAAANARGIQIHEGMGWEEISAHINQYDANPQLYANWPGQQSSMPSPHSANYRPGQFSQPQPYSTGAPQNSPYPKYNPNMPPPGEHWSQSTPASAEYHSRAQSPMKGAPPAFSAPSISRQPSDGFVPLAPAPTRSRRYTPGQDLRIAKIDTPQGPLKEFRIKRMETPESLVASRQNSAAQAQKKAYSGTSKFRVDTNGHKDGNASDVSMVDGSSDMPEPLQINPINLSGRSMAELPNGRPSSTNGVARYTKGGQLISFGED